MRNIRLRWGACIAPNLVVVLPGSGLPQAFLPAVSAKNDPQDRCCSLSYHLVVELEPPEFRLEAAVVLSLSGLQELAREPLPPPSGAEHLKNNVVHAPGDGAQMSRKLLAT